MRVHDAAGATRAAAVARALREARSGDGRVDLVIETLWSLLGELAGTTSSRTSTRPATLIDILLVTIAIYWLLLLIRGTRAVQILVGLIVLFTVRLASEIFQLVTVNGLSSTTSSALP